MQNASIESYLCSAFGMDLKNLLKYNVFLSTSFSRGLTDCVKHIELALRNPTNSSGALTLNETTEEITFTT